MTGLTNEHLIRKAKRVPIDVPRLPLSTLIQRACAHYNQLHPLKRPADPEAVSTNPQFVARICVNYLRHQATRYDSNRDFVRTSTVHAEVGLILKARTLVEIARVYPQLAAEARRQAQRTDQRQQR